MFIRTLSTLLICIILLYHATTRTESYDHVLKDCPMASDGQTDTMTGHLQRDYLKRFLGTDLPLYVCSRTDYEAVIVQRFFDVLTAKALEDGFLDALSHINHKDLYYILHGTQIPETEKHEENEFEVLQNKLDKIFDEVIQNFMKTQPEES